MLDIKRNLIMKKKLISILIAISLVSLLLTGCSDNKTGKNKSDKKTSSEDKDKNSTKKDKKKKKSDDDKNDKNANDNSKKKGYAGYDSEEELILAYIDCFNGDLSTEEFMESFDEVGFTAYWMTEEEDVGLYEAYNKVLADDTLMEQYGAELKERYFSPKQLRNDFDEMRDRLGVFERKVYQENMSIPDDPELSEYVYHIPVTDSKGGIWQAWLRYMEVDGKYVWIMCGYTE